MTDARDIGHWGSCLQDLANVVCIFRSLDLLSDPNYRKIRVAVGLALCCRAIAFYCAIPPQKAKGHPQYRWRRGQEHVIKRTWRLIPLR